MKVTFDLSTLAETRWYEYGVRFLFGGAITVIAGLLAKRFGPVFGGLFLAFPAIFPASATLVEEHEREKKRKAGITNTSRGRQAAALDARGAAIGSIWPRLFRFVCLETASRVERRSRALAGTESVARRVGSTLAGE